MMTSYQEASNAAATRAREIWESLNLPLLEPSTQALAAGLMSITAAGFAIAAAVERAANAMSRERR